MYHPINAFNLVKRVVKYLTKISNNEYIQKTFASSPEGVNFIFVQLANGIYNLEENYNMTPTDLVNGIIRDSATSKIYKSAKGLELEDILYVQDVANIIKNYDKQISWLEVATNLNQSDNRVR